MSTLSTGLIAAIAWSSLFVTIGAAVVCLLLRRLDVASPRVHRVACLLVVVQGWLVFPCTIEVPVIEQRPDPVLEVTLATGTRPSDRPGELSAAGVSEQPNSHDGLPWSRFILATWAGGIVVVVVLYAARYARFVWQTPLGRPPEKSEWASEWNNLRREMGLRGGLQLQMTRYVGPLLCFLPTGHVILTPLSLWENLTAAQRLAILRHEIAHYTRRDLWKSVAIRMLALPQWFNPIAWWAVRRFDEAGEWACDDLAKGEADEQNITYAATLLKLGELVIEAPAPLVAAHGGVLSRRIRRLLTSRFTEESIMKRAGLLALLLVLTATHFFRVELVAVEPDGEKATSALKTLPTPVKSHPRSVSAGDVVEYPIGPASATHAVPGAIEVRLARRELYFRKGQRKTLQFDVEVTGFDTDPSMLAVERISPKSLRIRALQAGTTKLELQTAGDGKHRLYVSAVGDAEDLRRLIEAEFDVENLDVQIQYRDYQVLALLSGKVSQPREVGPIVRFAERYFPTVKNNLKVGTATQVLIQMGVLEFKARPGSDVRDIKQLLPELNAMVGAGTVKLGIVKSGISADLMRKRLKQHGTVKLLAEPTIVTTDGRPASINVGGQIPYRIPDKGSYVVLFGTRVNCLPMVLTDGSLRLEVGASISEITNEDEKNIGKNWIPRIRSRRLDTAVELKSGQSAVLAQVELEPEVSPADPAASQDDHPLRCTIWVISPQILTASALPETTTK